MTPLTQTNPLDQMVELLAEHGFDGMAQAITVLMNEVMKLERSHALGAMPYQRSEHRNGHANGFKPKTLHARCGESRSITSSAPRVPSRTRCDPGRACRGRGSSTLCTPKTARMPPVIDRGDEGTGCAGRPSDGPSPLCGHARGSS